MRKKTESLKKVYNTMNDTSDTRYYSSLADDEKFKQYCDENNLSMIVVEDVTSRILFAYAKNSERLYSEIQFGVLDDFVRGKREILEATDNYIVEKKTDDVKAMDSVNMVGVLDNGNGFLITTPAQSLKDSALISNVFYLYIGLFTIFISSVVIWFISRHITRPLQQLSELSKEMANLNFDAKYTSTSEDEIGVLGNNLNRMSGELEKTISELRTANNELQKDIEKKESAQLLASQKEAEIRFLQEEPISVWGDEFKIEEVVTNYVSNALNHVDFEKKIEIKAVKRGDVVRLSVFNTGARIPEEDLDKIWIKFYKVDKARTREYGGSGIGLSIVKAIMDSMNQKCGVINYENGVEFWFELACGDTFC